MGINLKNFIWNRDPQEAMDNPYEWDAQKKFVKEANSFLREIRKHIIDKNSFSINDQSREKAIWMLSLAALDSGIEITIALKRNQIQVVYHLLRSIQEALDLATYFTFENEDVPTKISRWFNGEIIQHGEFRKFLEKNGDKEKAERLKDIHRALSKFNHNSYPTLLYSFFLDKNGFIHHYGRYESNSFKPANTIAMLHAISSKIILELSNQLVSLGSLELSDLSDFIGDQKRKRPVKRRLHAK
jgi:hypothetical protein